MMRIDRLRWIAVLAFAVAGCASMDKGTGVGTRGDDFRRDFPGGTLCNSKDCTVWVTITAGCGATAPTLGIDTSVDDATIHWKIQPGASGTVAFTRTGINPKPGSQWHREFKDPTLVGAAEFTWLDKNKLQGGPRKRPYNYSIEFTQDGKACVVDPTIVNDY